MKRVPLILTLALGLLFAPLVADAQQAGKVPRIGLLGTFSPEFPIQRAVRDAFRQGLHDLGYVEGKNIVIEYRWAEGRVERFPEFAAELARLKVDVIVVGNTPAALAAKHVTTTIPIVVASMQDPVGDGLVQSLARPGGNITGLTFLGPELVPKLLQLLKEAVPGVSRVAALRHPGGTAERTMRDTVKETELAARTLGVQLQFLEARSPNDFDRAFSAMTRERAGALIVFTSTMFYGEHRRIVDLAAKHRLPAIYAWREAVDAGGLMAYGANIPDLFRRAATFVDKILKGAKPGDLPVEQPTKFELVINLTIPQSVLLRADKVIE